MKRIFSLLLAAVLSGGLLTFSGCSSRAPELEDIYDRAVELIEASYELNVIFYGAGLPYYDRTLPPIYASFYNDYANDSYTRNYNIVSNHAKFNTIDLIKRKAEQVYSPTLLEQSLYPGAFDGLYVPGSGGLPSYSASARYREGNEDFYVLSDLEDFYSNPKHPRAPLIYDYSTMKIVSPSNAERVLLELTAWEEGRPESPSTERLTLVLVDGVWLLDSLTV